MSPWVFYAIDIVHSLRVVMIITTSLSIFGWVITFQSIAEDRFSSDDVRFLALILFIAMRRWFRCLWRQRGRI